MNIEMDEDEMKRILSNWKGRMKEKGLVEEQEDQEQVERDR